MAGPGGRQGTPFGKGGAPGEGRRARPRLIRRSRLPQTNAEITAYNCGRRLAGADIVVVEALTASGIVPTSYMEPDELAALDSLPRPVWWKWWRRGWGDGMEEE